jgi:hypothetical protein
MDHREVQEQAADRRQDEVVRAARTTRARVLEGLDALDRELQRVRKEAEKLPGGTSSPRRWGWLPWV